MYKVSHGENNIKVEKDGKEAVIEKTAGEAYPAGTAFISLGAMSLYEQSGLIEKSAVILLIEPAEELLEVARGLGFENITGVAGFEDGRAADIIKKTAAGAVIVLRNRHAYMFDRDFYRGALGSIDIALRVAREAQRINSPGELEAAFGAASGEEKEILKLMMLVYSGE